MAAIIAEVGRRIQERERNRRPCQRCDRGLLAITGQRYCHLCRHAVITKLEITGFLKPVNPEPSRCRSLDEREHLRETKEGPSPTWDLSVRALEEERSWWEAIADVY